MFRKSLRLIVTLGLLLCGAGISLAHADDAKETKPVFVISINNLDSAFADVTEVLKLFGNADVAKTAKLMKNVFARGISPTKPIGIFVLPNEAQDKLCLFGSIPVDDLKTVTETFKPQDDGPTDVGNGVFRLSISGTDVFAKEQNGNLIVAKRKEDLVSAPTDPIKLLGDLPQKAGIAFRFDKAGLPDSMKQMKVDDILLAIVEPSAETRANASQVTDEFAKRFDGVHQFESRLTRNAKTQMLSNVAVIRFSPNSPFHSDYLAEQELKSDAGNFILKDATASAYLVCKLSDESTQALKSLAGASVAWLTGDFSGEVLPPEVQQSRRQAINRILLLVGKSFEDNTIDLGASLRFEPKNLSFVMSARIGDSDEVRSAVQELAMLPSQNNVGATIEVDTETHRGVSIHTIKKPISPQLKGLAKMVGDEFFIAVGTGNGRVYVSLGRDAVTSLKGILDKPHPPKNDTDLVITLAPIKLATLLRDAEFSKTFNQWYADSIKKPTNLDAKFVFSNELRKDMHINKVHVPMNEFEAMQKSGELIWRIILFGHDPIDRLNNPNDLEENEEQ